MVRSNLPVYIQTSPAVSEALGTQVGQVAVVAIRAILKNRRGIEVAYQQIQWGEHHLALSSRITARGDLVVDIDVGDPNLANRLILEDELRRAERQAREDGKSVREAERKLRNTRRR